MMADIWCALRKSGRLVCNSPVDNYDSDSFRTNSYSSLTGEILHQLDRRGTGDSDGRNSYARFVPENQERRKKSQFPHHHQSRLNAGKRYHCRPEFKERNIVTPIRHTTRDAIHRASIIRTSILYLHGSAQKAR